MSNVFIVNRTLAIFTCQFFCRVNDIQSDRATAKIASGYIVAADRLLCQLSFELFRKFRRFETQDERIIYILTSIENWSAFKLHVNIISNVYHV